LEACGVVGTTYLGVAQVTIVREVVADLDFKDYFQRSKGDPIYIGGSKGRKPLW
jgi:hypothetical protein